MPIKHVMNSVPFKWVVVAVRMAILSMTLLVGYGCADEPASTETDRPKSPGAIPMDMPPITLSATLDSFAIGHNAICEALLDSVASGYIVLDSTYVDTTFVNGWPDSVKSVAKANILSKFGYIYTTPVGASREPSHALGGSLTILVNSLSGMSSDGKQIVRDLDTLIDEYCETSMTLSTFLSECVNLKTRCMGLGNDYQALLAGSFVMTAAGSAQFWHNHADDFNNLGYTNKKGPSPLGYDLDEKTKKVIKADVSSAGKAVVFSGGGGGSIGALLGAAFFSGAVGSFYKGVMRAINKEGSWYDVLGSWFMG